MNLSQNQNNLPRGAIGFALGIAGMLVSLYYSIAFIAGTATGAELIAGIVFALVMDYAKVALGSEALIALGQFRLLSAVVYTLIVISLYALSMFSATFMLSSHNSNASLQAKTSQVTTLQADIAAKRAELDKCPAGALTKCVNPRTAELSSLQAQLADANQLSHDDAMAQNLTVTWEKFAHVIGDTPDSLQVKLAFFRAFLLEIIAPILVSLFLAYYRNKTPQSPNLERVIENAAPSPSAQVFHSEPSISLPKQSAMNMTKLEKKL
jgi:membrane protein implicated in regulation of membrane protease activity